MCKQGTSFLFDRKSSCIQSAALFFGANAQSALQVHVLFEVVINVCLFVLHVVIKALVVLHMDGNECRFIQVIV